MQGEKAVYLNVGKNLEEKKFRKEQVKLYWWYIIYRENYMHCKK